LFFIVAIVTTKFYCKPLLVGFKNYRKSETKMTSPSVKKFVSLISFLKVHFCFCSITKVEYFCLSNALVEAVLTSLLAISNSAGKVLRKPAKVLRCQFHQHFTRAFFVRKFRAKLFCTFTVKV
jgi:hypothetical protein